MVFLGISLNEEVQIHHKLLLAKNNFPYPLFMEIFMVAAWCIWNERNALIFNGKAPSVASWKPSFKREIESHLCKIKQILHSFIRLRQNSLYFSFLFLSVFFC